MKYSDLKDARDFKIGDTVFAVSKIRALKAFDIYKKIVELEERWGRLGFSMVDEDTVKNILQYAAYKNESTKNEWRCLDNSDDIEAAFSSQKDMLQVLHEMYAENFGFLADGSLLKLLGLQGAETASDS